MQGSTIVFSIKGPDQKSYEICEAALLRTLGVIDTLDASDANHLWKTKKSTFLGRNTTLPPIPRSDKEGIKMHNRRYLCYHDFSKCLLRMLP